MVMAQPWALEPGIGGVFVRQENHAPGFTHAVQFIFFKPLALRAQQVFERPAQPYMLNLRIEYLVLDIVGHQNSRDGWRQILRNPK
jgi:hypothetical protein